MSNTMTLGQEADALALEREVFDLKQKQTFHEKEISLYNELVERVKQGEFPDVDAARAAATSTFAGRASQATVGALESVLATDRDWKALNDAYERRIGDLRSLDEKWAQARADLQARMGGAHKGNGFTRTESIHLNDDGSATISAEMVGILVEASKWVNASKIDKVSGFLNATASGALTLEVKVNNPHKVKKG